MANRTFYPSQSYGSSRVYAEFFLLGNGASAPAYASVDGSDIVSPTVAITRSSQGVYVVTLKDNFNKVVFASAEMDDTAADGAYATIGNIANEGTATPLALTVNVRSGVNQSGTATLAAGTKTVTGVTVPTGATIFVSYNTPGGTPGTLSVPAASRTGTQFVINSSSGTDTSTVDWTIQGPAFVDAALNRKIRVCLALRNGNWGVK